MEVEHQHQRVYEQLGAPSLLYRNVDAYATVDEDVMVKTPDAAKGFQDVRERLSRAQARWYFPQLMKDTLSSEENESTSRDEQSEEDISAAALRKRALERQGHSSQLIDAMQQCDAPYVPAGKPKVGRVSKKRGRRHGVRQSVQQLSHLYARERQKRGDPDYMAPFELQRIETLLCEKSKTVQSQKRRQKLVFDGHHPNGPTRYGNCIVCFSCTCRVCRTRKPLPSVYLLHPVGVIQDHVRLSFVFLPRDVAETDVAEVRKDLDMGDTVRQLQECGDLTFVARTDLHCTVFSVELVKPKNNDLAEEKCRGRCFRLCRLHRIDLRSLSRSMPSFTPIDVACHPKYGRSFTKPNIAILSERSESDRHTVHHVQCSQSVRMMEHTYANLQDISVIDFTTMHPMVLWAAGRSHVRPALVANELTKRPRVGYGSSLFSLDLRTSKAVYQWSPSKDDFLIEGAHSISGIYTDWEKHHSVWVASTSAGKTWELDSRMPCTPVTAWSLAHACDEPGVVLPSAGLYGAGTLFSKPVGRNLAGPCPILSVGKTPGSFGLHLYQRPEAGPRFQTNSIECAANASLSSLKDASVALSLTFALPDVSDGVFTCGLCSFKSSSTEFLSVPDLVRMGFIEEEITGVVSAITMTNKGDLYVHSLLESKAAHEASTAFAGLPVGAAMVAVPSPESSQAAGKAMLSVSLSNEYPIPSRAFYPPAWDAEPVPGVLHLPTRTQEGGNSEQTGGPTMDLAPSDTLPVVNARRSRNVSIPAEWIAKAEDQLENTHASFTESQSKWLAGTTAKTDVKPCRSDITENLVQKASDAWRGDSSDDSSDSDG